MLLPWLQLAEEAGFPPGVINIVTSSRDNAGKIGKVWCEHPLVAKISFTGSTAVGKVGKYFYFIISKQPNFFTCTEMKPVLCPKWI